MEILVPLELIDLKDDGFHLLVEVVVFGHIFNIVLDTGASRTVFDKSTTERYLDPKNLLRSELLSAGLGTVSMESYTVILPSLTMGTLDLPNLQVAILDLSTICSTYTNLNLPPIIGVLGGDILRKYKAIIDYQNLSLKLIT
ncbi:MAG TPA: retropepsin-like aspartic protease [Sphingobacteriaceae bacterium]|nr:retropepsin-like aspartic protease [Sphingobacteriaceae bacterium]